MRSIVQYTSVIKFHRQKHAYPAIRCFSTVRSTSTAIRYFTIQVLACTMYTKNLDVDVKMYGVPRRSCAHSWFPSGGTAVRRNSMST